MRIINKEEFYEMPAGTLYNSYGKSWLSGLKIKGGTLRREDKTPFDYYYLNLIGNVACDNSEELYNKLDSSKDKGTNFTLDFECQSRDGLYEEDEMFAVYNTADLTGLIDCLILIRHETSSI